MHPLVVRLLRDRFSKEGLSELDRPHNLVLLVLQGHLDSVIFVGQRNLHYLCSVRAQHGGDRLSALVYVEGEGVSGEFSGKDQVGESYLDIHWE